MLTVSAHSLLPTPDSILKKQLSTTLPEAKLYLQSVPCGLYLVWWVMAKGYVRFLNKHDLLCCENEKKITVS